MGIGIEDRHARFPGIRSGKLPMTRRSVWAEKSIRSTLRSELTWTYCKVLTRVEHDQTHNGT